MEVQPTGYWTFFCNPTEWPEMDDFLSSSRKYDDYLVTDYQAKWFNAGQLGVIRVGRDRRRADLRQGKERLQPGIYAVVEVLGKARARNVRRGVVRQVVDLKYLKKLLDRPVLLEQLKTDPAVNDRYLLRGFQASTMPLDARTFRRIGALTGGEVQLLENVDHEQADSHVEIQALERKYADATPQVKEAIAKCVERGAFGERIKRLADFKCQLCKALGQDPVSFQTRSRRPYVEAHHAVFVSKVKKGTLAPSNLMVLCANHHRQLHYGCSELIENTVERFVFHIDGANVTVGKLIRRPTATVR